MTFKSFAFAFAVIGTQAARLKDDQPGHHSGNPQPGLAQVDGSESWTSWGLHKAEDAAIDTAEAAAWSMFA